jgi:hypothetical protein
MPYGFVTHRARVTQKDLRSGAPIEVERGRPGSSLPAPPSLRGEPWRTLGVGALIGLVAAGMAIGNGRARRRHREPYSLTDHHGRPERDRRHTGVAEEPRHQDVRGEGQDRSAGWDRGHVAARCRGPRDRLPEASLGGRRRTSGLRDGRCGISADRADLSTARTEAFELPEAASVDEVDAEVGRTRPAVFLR